MYRGDIALGATIDLKFTTRSFTTGVPGTLAGSPVISAYVDNGTTQLTAGITLSVDFDSVTGLNNVRVVATSGNGYATATNVDLVITTGTVGGVSVVGEVIGSFSIEARSAIRPATAGRTLVVDAAGLADANVVKVGPTGSGTAQTARDLGASVLLSSGTGTGQLNFTSGVVKADVSAWLGTAVSTPTVAGVPNVNTKTWNDLATVALPLIPTTAGRTLDVTATGEAGIDWANVGSPTTTLALTGTTIASTQKVDIETIKTNPVVNAGTITFPTGATLASTTNITAGTITTVTNLTNAPTAGDLTATMKTSVENAVWDTVLASHLTAGTTGFALNAAGSAGDPWGTTLPGAYGAGTAGHIIGTALPDIAPGSANGLLRAGTNAATAITTALTANLIGNVTGNLSGSVGSVTGLTAANLDVTVSSRLAPTVAARTLDVSAAGNAGIDWSNIEAPTTAQNLAATNIDVDQIVASVSGAVGSVTGAVGSVASGGIAAASFAAGAIDAAAIANAAIDAATFAAGALDAVWSTAARVLTAGTNIVLAKGTGITGFNDITAASVWAVATRELTSGANIALAKGVGLTGLNDIAAVDVWTSATRTLTAGTNIVLAKGVGVTGFTDLSQADVRTAIGIASANVDTQLSGIATNASTAAVASANLDATVSSRATPAQVNTEVVDALAVDTYAEPTGAPAATATLAAKINRLYQVQRNKLTVTATTLAFSNDAGAVLWSKALADDGTTYTESEGA